MANDKTLNTKATGVIALAVMLSRCLGLIREVLFNALFGTSSMGVFLVAFRAPNLLRDLFAEGALSISFITIFSKKIETEGVNSAWVLASKILTLTTVFMSLVSLLGILFANQMISVLAPGFSPEDAQLTIYLTQIMYPFILLVSLAALVMGMLNSRNIFGVPALASSFFNIGSILGGAFFGWLLDPHFGVKSLAGLAIGTMVGGIFQLCIQLPSLRKIGFRFKPDFRWNDPGIKAILILTLPAVITASTVQLNVLINTSFASYIGKEAVTWLNSAFRLMQLPIGIFGVAVATITLPVISRIAATKDLSQFGPTLGRAMRLAIFLTMPAAVGLWFFANPIIGLIYEHGKFFTEDTAQTAFALQFYALGLVAYSCIKVLSPGFYAIDRKWIPMFVSLASLALNLGLNYVFIFKLGMQHRGLALSTAICAIANFLTLYCLMSLSHSLQTARLLFTVVRCTIASVALGATCYYSLHYLANYIYNPSIWIRGLSLLILISFAGIVYLSASLILKIDSAISIINTIKQKLSKIPSPPNLADKTCNNKNSP